MNRRLYRSWDEKVIGGVAGGVADYLDADPAIVRVIWALLALVTGGVFLILYIVMWIVVPVSPEAGVAPGGGAVAGGEPGSTAPAGWSATPPRRRRPSSGAGSWFFGLILIGLGGYFLVREYVTWIDWDRLWPLGLVLLGVLLLVVGLRRREA